MSKTSLLIAFSLLLLPLLVAGSITIQPLYAQEKNNTSVAGHQQDSSPEVAIIVITKDAQGGTFFEPNTVTINAGEEILILNNDTSVNTFTNGEGKSDQMSGKLFDTGDIKPGEFTEYTASNLQTGKYPFYSSYDESAKGELIVR